LTSLTTTLPTTDSAKFGWSVSGFTDSSTDITILAVGAIGQTNAGTVAKGAVFVYLLSDSNDDVASEHGVIVCPDPTLSSSWAYSVAAGVVQFGPSKGQYFVIVGSPNSAPNGMDGAGLVYIYTSADAVTWSVPTTLRALDASADANFGYSVAWDESTDQAVIVGAPFAADNVGAAYVFTNKNGTASGWSQSAMLSASSPSTNSGFGSSVCMTYGAAVVGAPNAATAYFYYDSSLPTLAPTTASENHSESALSQGAVAGIVIGVLGAVAIGCSLVYFLFYSKSSASTTLTQPVLSPMNNYGDAL
jgi:hypothetical protein